MPKTCKENEANLAFHALRAGLCRRCHRRGKEIIGQEVWGTGGDVGFTRDGSHAEYIVIPKRGARPKPKSLSMVEAASVGRNYVTAYFGLVQKAQLKEGETVLVTGASGGVGSSAIKIAKSKAARVIAVYRQAPEPEKARQLGIDLALSSPSDDFTNRVKQFTQGKGVDVAFDCVGGPLFELHSIRWEWAGGK